MEAAPQLRSGSSLDLAKRILRDEAQAIEQFAAELGEDFVAAIDHLAACRGAIVVTGMGKAGLVGQKVSATLCSTGSRSFFLHPAEAIHGDLGRVTAEDKVLALSLSGETEELLRVLPSLLQLTDGIVSITSRRTSSLARQSRVVLPLGGLTEAGVHGLAPSTSTTLMMALGDALALTLSEQRGFQPRDFVQFHPGGSLGRKLTRVTQVMRPLDQCRLAPAARSVRETFVSVQRTGRRTGAVMIVDSDERLVGLFTDSDLARLLESQSDRRLDAAVGDVMTQNPIAIEAAAMMTEAIELLAENHISELPVVDASGRPLGMIDITDVISWFPPQHDPAANQPKLLPFPRDEP